MANMLSSIREYNLARLQIAAKKKVMGRRKRLPSAPKMLYPNAIDRRYRKLLRIYVATMRLLVNQILMPEVRRIIEGAKAERPSLDSVNLDEYDYADEVAKLMSLIQTQFVGRYSDDEIAAMVGKIAEAVAAQNGKELGKVFTNVLGVDVFTAEPWLAVEMRAFVTSNVGLIKTIPANYFAQIEVKVFDAARRGLSYKELQKDIQKTYGSSKARAELIARDQIGKFNGQLDLLRQTQAGLSRYQWQTVGDERVREEHRNQNGKIFYWSKPPATGHPGEDYQCRCRAVPYLDDLWKLPGDELTPVPVDLLGSI